MPPCISLAPPCISLHLPRTSLYLQARQEATHSRAALRELQQELEDEREARARADKQLAQALGHG